MSDERLKIGQRVIVVAEGTVEDVSDAHGSAYGIAFDQRDYDPELKHFRFAWFDRDEIELRARKQRDLTSEEREGLEWTRMQLNAIRFQQSATGNEHPSLARALSAISWLLGREG